MFQFCRPRPVQIVHINVDEGKLETQIFTYHSLFLLLHNSIIYLQLSILWRHFLPTTVEIKNRKTSDCWKKSFLSFFNVLAQKKQVAKLILQRLLFACGSFVACERRHMSIASLHLKRENWRPEKRLLSQGSIFFKAPNKRLQWNLDKTNRTTI